LETVRSIADMYGSMSLVELDGYFEGKFEPVKYTRIEVHTNEPVEGKITDFANKIRIKFLFQLFFVVPIGIDSLDTEIFNSATVVLHSLR
jgi:hypothetical protein